MLKLTLTPNRADQKRYARIVRYERRGNVVTPLLVTRTTVRQLSFADIKPAPTDFETARAWMQHIKGHDCGTTIEEHNAAMWRRHVREQRREKEAA